MNGNVFNNTSFYRTSIAYEELEKYLNKERINVLSLGCSTGQEVWSLMNFFKDKNIYAVGIDQNKPNIEVAKNALYVIDVSDFKDELFTKIKDPQEIKHKLNKSLEEIIEDYKKLLHEFKNYEYDHVISYLIFDLINFKHNVLPTHKMAVMINDDYRKKAKFINGKIGDYVKKAALNNEKFDVVQYTFVDFYVDKKEREALKKYLPKITDILITDELGYRLFERDVLKTPKRPKKASILFKTHNLYGIKFLHY